MTNSVRDKNGAMLSIGSFVRICGLARCPFEGKAEADLYNQAKDKVARIIPLVDSDYEFLSSYGDFLVRYVDLSEDGVQSISFYVTPDQVEEVAAIEELLLLYSDDLWQFLAPFGEPQNSATYRKLRDFLDLDSQ
ncbi:MAG: hypothetical protein ABJG15_17110 [Hyphomonadaceae bacterium]